MNKRNDTQQPSIWSYALVSEKIAHILFISIIKNRISMYLGCIYAIYHSLFVVHNTKSIMFKIVVKLFNRLVVIYLKYMPYFDEEDKVEVQEIMETFKKLLRRKI